MLLKQRTLLAVGIMSLLFSSAVQALILDFNEVSSGFQGSTTITLSNATINSLGTDSFVYHPGDFGALGGGGFCGIAGGSCEASAEVLFAFAIDDLTLNTQFFDPGDTTLLEIFSGAALLGSLAVASDTAVDFTGFSGITRLLITDSSSGAGFAYTNFEFVASTAVPEPSTLALLGIGLFGMGLSRRKKV